MPVIENAADADVVVGLLLERANEILGSITTADDDRPAFHDAIAAPVADGEAKDQSSGENGDRGNCIPDAEGLPGMQRIGKKEEKETGCANEGQADRALNASEHRQWRA